MATLPAGASVYLQAFCYQKLCIVDGSYKFSLSKELVPAYMANVSNFSKENDSENLPNQDEYESSV